MKQNEKKIKKGEKKILNIYCIFYIYDQRKKKNDHTKVSKSEERGEHKQT